MYFNNRVSAVCVAMACSSLFFSAPLSAATYNFNHFAPSDIKKVISEVWKYDSNIQAAESAVNAARHRVANASMPLYNPELDVSTERTDITTTTIGISQTVDWHGKVDAQARLAATEQRIAEADIGRQKLELATVVLKSMGDIVAKRNMLKVDDRRIALLKRFQGLTEERFQAGDANQSDVQLASLSLNDANFAKTLNLNELAQAAAEFNKLTGKKLPKDIGINSPLSFNVVEPAVPEEAILLHPNLFQETQRTQLAKIRVAVADKQRKPDPTLGFTLGREDTQDLYGVSVSVPLQVFNNGSASVDAARAEALQQEQIARQRYREIRIASESSVERFMLLRQALLNWKNQGLTDIEKQIELINQYWQSGEISTADYILQLQQTVDAEVNGVNLEAQFISAWIDWLNASGAMFDWLEIKA